MPREAITITLPDGSTREGTSWETTPLSVALSISKGLAEKTVIAKVGSASHVGRTIGRADWKGSS